MIWLILLLVHIALVVVALAIAKRQKETQWLLFTGLCLLPLMGPLLVIYAYILNTTINNEYKDFPGSSKKS